MPAWYEIRFSDLDGTIDWYGSRGFYYEFADGTNIGLHPTIAWCCKCSAFVDAEWIPALDYIENELVELHTPGSMAYESHTSTEPPFDKSPFKERRARIFEEAKTEAALRIDWRKKRISPPKCLICGSLEIKFPDDDNGTVEIPGRGTAKVECCGMCSTEFCNWFYTPEGDRIPRETKPTYWHLPEDTA